MQTNTAIAEWDAEQALLDFHMTQIREFLVRLEAEAEDRDAASSLLPQEKLGTHGPRRATYHDDDDDDAYFPCAR